MDMTMQHVQLNVPRVDVAFLKSLAQRMGWEMVKGNTTTSECHLDKAIVAAKRGPLFETNDIDELMSALR